MKALFILKRFIQDFPRLFVATCLSLLILSAGGVFAATSYDVGNEPQMYLDASINTTATTIVLSSPQVNGANHLFSTTSGAVLRIRSGFYREDIYVPSATVSTTTNKVTLSNVVRNLCPYTGHNYVSCGAGRNWGKGAIVELTVDKNLLNSKANRDRDNKFTGSGAVAFSGSGSLAFPNFSSSAERNRQMGAVPRDGMRACVTSDNLCYYGMNGVWVAEQNSGIADNRFVNIAGDTMTGTLTIRVTGAGNTTIGMNVPSTVSGTLVHAQTTLTSSGNLVVVGTTRLKGTMTGATAIFGPALPIVDCTGATTQKVLWNASTGKFTCGSDNSTSTGLSQDAADARYVQIQGSTMTGALLGVINEKVVEMSSTQTKTGANMITNWYLGTHNYTIPANTLVNGVAYRFSLAGSGSVNAGSLKFNTYLGTNIVCPGQTMERKDGATGSWYIKGTVYGTTTAGASVVVKCEMDFFWSNQDSFTTPNVWFQNVYSTKAGIATNGSLLLQFGGINTLADAGNNFYANVSTIEKISSSTFSPQ